MKYSIRVDREIANESRPARGAWVEIRRGDEMHTVSDLSRPARGAWVEIQYAERMSIERWSRPARGAWVEIIHAHDTMA